MVTVLCVWEQGSNLGHLSNLRLPIEVALSQGHRVVLAARELHQAKVVFGDMPIVYLPAPFKYKAKRFGVSQFLSFTHLMAHQCFEDADELGMYLQAWRTLFSLIQPDVVLFEHSPTALIAAHDKTFRKVLVGNGFFVPSPGSDPHAPFLPFPTTQLSPEVVAGLMHDDAALLACINRALFSVNAPPLPALHAMFNQVDASLLMTWPELDHFGAQAQRKYMGVEPPLARVSPQWPEGEGPRVFGYLSAIPSLETLLNDLVAAQVCALLFVRNLPPTLRERFSGPQMRFADQPVDLAEVARQAAWVINSGNHSTAATFAAAGVPQLIIPLHQEHLFMALRLVSQGSAVMAFQDQSAYSAAISALQTNPRIREKARALQAQIPPYDATAAHSLVAQALSLHRT